MPDLTSTEIADQIMLHVVYQGREGTAMSSAAREDHEYLFCQNAATEISSRLSEQHEVAHWECNCVPNDGPPHCHACGRIVGYPVAWVDAVHGPSAASSSLVATREALANDVGYPAVPDDVDESHSEDYAEGYARGFNNAFENVIASGVVREVGDVKAEQREKDADLDIYHEIEGVLERYGALKLGLADALSESVAAAIRGGEKND